MNRNSYSNKYNNGISTGNSKKYNATNSNQKYKNGLQQKKRKAALFAERYNKTVAYLNGLKNGTIWNILQNISVSFVIQVIKECKININQLDKINQALIKTRDYSLNLHNIIVNPFDFIRDDIQLITYEKAEKINDTYSLNIPFETKCRCWAFDLLRKNNTFYIDSYRFYRDFRDYCTDNEKNHNSYLDMINTKVVDKKIKGRPYKTTEYLMGLEKKMTDKMLDIFHQKNYNIDSECIMEEIGLFETNKQITLSDDQRTAVIQAIANKLFIINGFPGTGKSTIVECILFVFKQLHKKYGNNQGHDDDDDDDEDDSDSVVEQLKNEPIYSKVAKYPDSKNISILAPTGLAYINLANKCSSNIGLSFNRDNSGTCHRVMYTKFPKILAMINKKNNDNNNTNNNKTAHVFSQYILEESEKREEKSEEPIVPQLIIIDEFSMIDSFIYDEILDWCCVFKCRLIILGDENQLPSIGPGCNLKNIIDSNIFEQIKLKEIRRQTGVLMANIKKMTYEKIRRPDFVDDSMVLLDIDDFMLEGEMDSNKIKQLVEQNNFTKDNTKFLTYFNKETYASNVNNLNNILQKIFNPTGNRIESNSLYPEKIQFREGDNIIRIENDYSGEDIKANGEQAKIGIHDKNENITQIQYIDEGNKNESVDNESLYSDFTLSYALTVHKSQGSQYDNVVVIIDKNQNIWDKTALYTAISRAKLRCIIVAKYEDFKNIQSNASKSAEKVSLFLKESDEYEL